jgi:RNase P/RNase MRP subunit p30
MKKAKKDIRNAQKFDIPIIASSGAQEPIMMREPRALVSLLEALNIEEENAINMVTNNPSEIITRNTEKIKSKFYSPWVRRVL